MTDFFPIVVTALAALVQGCLGFGAGLLSMAILSLVWEVRDATVIMAPVGWLMVASLVVKLGKDTTPRALIPIFTAIPIGVFGGIYALDVLPGVLLKSLLGLTLLAFVGHSLRKNNLRAPPRLSTICDRSRSTLGLHGGRAQRRRPSSSHLCNGGRLGKKTAFEQIYRPYFLLSQRFQLSGSPLETSLVNPVSC